MFENAGIGQPSLMDTQSAALEADPGTDYGEVFTRRWVVELILDLVGYVPEADLASLSLVEPSCGTGAFLLPIVDRLLESASQFERPYAHLRAAVRAYEVLEANADLARKAVLERLREAGVDRAVADELVGAWIVTGDFLLHDHEPGNADHVVGNPPYVRLEAVPRSVMETYREACPTMRGRSDIYVGFIELGLRLLKPGGSLGFICADRWMHNQYGGRLREVVASHYAIDAVISMHDVAAFENEVSAYPAVIVLRNGPQGRVAVVEAQREFDEGEARALSQWATARHDDEPVPADAAWVDGWFDGCDLWPAGSPAQLAVIAELEARFEPLESLQTGTRVGIGVATGCDSVFITRDPELVEPERLLPLLRPSDIAGGGAGWDGSYLVNPWTDDELVQLDSFPRLRAYFVAHADRLRQRHVARRRPEQWYRTIDRVRPSLQTREKLVLPDIKATAHPVLDSGNFYPHHNLYYVVSDAWDLEVLGGLLLSQVANLFVGAYCVKMRGGCYRFQAQYLRKIRVPDPRSLDLGLRRDLAQAFAARDVEAATAAALRSYGLGPSAAAVLRR